MRRIRRGLLGILILIALALLGTTLWCGGGANRKAAADRASATLHARYDAGRYHDIYKDASFSADSEEAFVTFLDLISRTAGRCGRAVPKRRAFHYDFTSETAEMRYSRHCERADVNEDILWRWDGNIWRLTQFHVAPMVR